MILRHFLKDYFLYNFKILISIFVLCLFTGHAQAWNWDLSHDALARSYPIAGMYQVRGGLSQTFWDQRTEGSKSPLFGFVRSAALFRSSGLINTAEVELAIYPISILGLFLRESYSVRRLNNLDTFDCDQIDCRGEIRRSEFGGRLALAYAGIFTMHEWRWPTVDSQTSGILFADEMTTTELPNRKVRQSIRLSILGYQLNDTWSLGVLNLDNRILGPLEEHTYKLMGLGQYKKADWTLALAAGVFHNRYEDNVFSTLLLWKWNYHMGDMLF
jgi:hypothetical protein